MKETKNVEIVNQVIDEACELARYGIFFCRNLVGDKMFNLYHDGVIQVDICYRQGYFEVFGLTEAEQKEVEKHYNKVRRLKNKSF